MQEVHIITPFYRAGRGRRKSECDTFLNTMSHFIYMKEFSMIVLRTENYFLFVGKMKSLAGR